MTTEEHLAKLEKELDRAKRRNRRLLAGLVICLAAVIVAWTLGLARQPRYALSGVTSYGMVYVLDTRTSQMWFRGVSTGEAIYLGTNEAPEEGY